MAALFSYRADDIGVLLFFDIYLILFFGKEPFHVGNFGHTN